MFSSEACTLPRLESGAISDSDLGRIQMKYEIDEASYFSAIDRALDIITQRDGSAACEALTLPAAQLKSGEGADFNIDACGEVQKVEVHTNQSVFDFDF
jgi:hypothetical protein